MIVIKQEDIVNVDVDDTLVMWDDEYFRPHEGAGEFYDPYVKETKYLKIHHRHVELVKAWKGQGRFVHVWSAGGYRWAESVVNSLGLTDYVDMISTKPFKVLDDLPSSEILTSRVYLPYKERA